MNKVVEVSKRIWEATQRKEVETLLELIHKDAVFVHMGVTLSRDEEIDTIKNERIVYKEIEFEDYTIKEIESTIILLNKLKLTAVVGGNEVTNPFVVTEVFTKKNDEVKLASLSYTKIVY